MITITDYLKLRRTVDVLYDIQDVRMRTANRLRLMPKKTTEVYVSPLLEIEKGLTKEIEGSLLKLPIYDLWLQQVKGIGPRIAGSIIAHTMIRFERVSGSDFKKISQPTLETQNEIASQLPCETQNGVAFSKEQVELAQKTEKGDYLIPVLRGIKAFDTISKLWAWWGLHVVDGQAAKRKRGTTIDWNPRLRTLAWKIGKQFVLQGEYYRNSYDEYKAKISNERLPLGKCAKYQQCLEKLKKRKKPACKGHIDAMARRYAVKLFLSHLWAKWRELEGLPVSDPYVIDKLGHNTKTEPPSADVRA